MDSGWVVIGGDHAQALAPAILVNNGAQGDTLWILCRGPAVDSVLWLVGEAAQGGEAQVTAWRQAGCGGGKASERLLGSPHVWGIAVAIVGNRGRGGTASWCVQPVKQTA